MTDGEHGGTRWLNHDEREAWVALSEVMMRLPAALDAQLQRDEGLTIYEYFVLSGLSERPGRAMSMGELAVGAFGSVSRLSHVVKRLEGKGWVRREVDPADGRRVNAVLTDAGWDKVVAAAPGHVEAVRGLVVDLLEPVQHVQLGAIGRRILARLRPGRC